MTFNDKEIEIVIKAKPCGPLLDVTVRSNTREAVRILAVLRQAFRNIYAAVNDRKLARKALLLGSNHKGVYERN